MNRSGNILVMLSIAATLAAIVAASSLSFQNGLAKPTRQERTPVLQNVSNDNLKTWKEILFPQYGFSFKIPDGWKIGVGDNSPGEVENIADQMVIGGSPTKVHIYKDGDKINFIEFDIPKGIPGGIIKHGINEEFNAIISTIKYSSASFATRFDHCGKLAAYTNRTWYFEFQKILTREKINAKEITEICAALDQSKVIFIRSVVYCDGPAIYTYGTSSKKLLKANIIDHDRGCLASPKEFGTRNGSIIPLRGEGGDAGCEAIMDYYYDLENNTVELKQERSRCQNDPWETTHY